MSTQSTFGGILLSGFSAFSGLSGLSFDQEAFFSHIPQHHQFNSHVDYNSVFERINYLEGESYTTNYSFIESGNAKISAFHLEIISHFAKKLSTEIVPPDLEKDSVVDKYFWELM